MKKMMIAVMVILMMPMAFALDVLSIDDIYFESNDVEVSGDAIVLVGVENGISEQAYFNVREVENALPSDREIKGQGRIISELTDYKVSYPITNTNDRFYSVSQVCDGSDCTFGHDGDDALAQCEDIAGNFPVIVYKYNYVVQYRCFAFNVEGNSGQFETYEILWENRFTVEDENGNEAARVTLSESKQTGKTNRFKASKVGNLVSDKAPPAPGENYRPFYSTANNRWKIIDRDYNPGNYDYGSTRDKLVNCLNEQGQQQTSLGIDYAECVDVVNNQVIEATNQVLFQTYDNDIVTEQDGGRLILTNTPVFLYPTFKLRINAEMVGVYAPSGEPVINSFSPGESEFVEGESGYFESEVKNNADFEASFDYQFECDKSYVSNIGYESFDAGETKTKKHYVTADTQGEVTDECRLTVVDTQNPDKSDTRTATITFVDANQCDDVGQQRCTADGTIQQCSRVGGSKVWTNIKQCQESCTLIGDVATCEDDDDDPVCGDSYCDAKERNVDSDFYCPSDCNPDQDNTILWIIGGTLGLIGLMYALSKNKKGGNKPVGLGGL